jgi:signal peptidase I
MCVWLVILAGISIVWLWRTPDVQLLSVQSGSMQPLIRKGDAVITEPVQATVVIHAGDIISYHSPADARVIIIHRVQSISSRTGLIITKGDNAPRADEPFAPDMVVGRVRQRIAYVGYGIDLLHSMAGLVLIIYLPALFAVGLELRRLTAYFQPTYTLRT